MRVRNLGLSICLALFLMLVVAAPAFGTSYLAGFEGENKWHSPYQWDGGYGVRADIYTPTPYPVYHSGTMKACVQVVWPNPANEWMARAGWKSDPAEQEAYSYWEGYTPDHSYVTITYRDSGPQPRYTARAYEIKQATGGSKLYNIKIVGSFRAQVSLHDVGVKACSGLSRASGLNNDLRAQFRTCQLWLGFGYWDSMGRSPRDYALSPIHGGGKYHEQPWGIPYKEKYNVWNSDYGVYY